MCVVFGLCPAVFCVVILISLFTASVNFSISSFVKVCVPCIRKCHIVSFTPFDISVLLILTCTPFLYPYLSIRYVRPFHTLQYLSSALIRLQGLSLPGCIPFSLPLVLLRGLLPGCGVSISLLVSVYHSIPPNTP